VLNSWVARGLLFCFDAASRTALLSVLP